MKIPMLRNEPAAGSLRRIGMFIWIENIKTDLGFINTNCSNLHRAELLTQCRLLAYWCVKLGKFLCGFGISSKVMRLKFEARAKIGK